MATTFSSNIGSGSLGGFSAYAVTTDDYVSAFFADMVTGNVINSTDGEEQYATTLSAQQLAALSTNLKGLLAAAVASGADPTTAPLAYLRKLVGFVALDDGRVLDYQTDTYTVGGVNYTEFYIDIRGGSPPSPAPGTVMMYIPNSASAGLFTGSGSDNASGGGGGGGSGGRPEYVANVPGLYLQSVACLVAPNFGPAVTIDPAQCGGFAQTPGLTSTRSFLVEKTSVAAPAAVGSGDQLFLVDFAVGDNAATLSGQTPANYEIATGELLRIVNPTPGDADLADVAISLIGTL